MDDWQSVPRRPLSPIGGSQRRFHRVPGASRTLPPSEPTMNLIRNEVGECSTGVIRLCADAFGPHGTAVLDD